MEESLLTVIVPVYNVEQYLEKCINSIINQTYRNLQIILVDDGSTDSSSKICERYAENDSRIFLIHKKNGGQSTARNCGLDIAKGDFVTFVDSDDWLELGTYSNVIEAMLLNNADVGAFNFKKIAKNKADRISSTINESTIIYDSEQSFVNIKAITFQVWNKIYRKALIKDFRFKENQLYEDIYFSKRVLLRMSRLVYLSVPYYNYLVGRPGSTVSTFNSGRLAVFSEFSNLLNDLTELKMNYAYYVINKFVLGFYISLYRDARNFKASKDIQSKILEEFRSSFKNSRINDLSLNALIFRINPAFSYELYKMKKLYLKE